MKKFFALVAIAEGTLTAEEGMNFRKLYSDAVHRLNQEVVSAAL